MWVSQAIPSGKYQDWVQVISGWTAVPSGIKFRSGSRPGRETVITALLGAAPTGDHVSQGWETARLFKAATPVSTCVGQVWEWVRLS